MEEYIITDRLKGDIKNSVNDFIEELRTWIEIGGLSGMQVNINYNKDLNPDVSVKIEASKYEKDAFYIEGGEIKDTQ